MKYFVTGTGTDIGKTYVCKLLCKQNGWQMAKPVASGGGEDGIDSKWLFNAPLSPDIAAKQEGKVIDFAEVVEYCKASTANLIEGAGGIMSPIATGKLNLDLANALNLPVLLVCGSYLRAISHALTAINALKNHKITVIINESAQSPMPAQQTTDVIKEFSGLEPIVLLRDQKLLSI